MKHRVWLWLVAGVGGAGLIPGCGGTVKDTVHGQAGAASGSLGGATAGAPGGSGNAGLGTSGGGNGAVVPPSGGAAGVGTCLGSLDTVAAIFGDCPPTLCAGMVWAESCSGMQNQPTAGVQTCDGLRVITLDFGTHGKDCYYALDRAPGVEPKLVGASAWGDSAEYCNDSSFKIDAGSTSDCNANASNAEIVCGGSNGGSDSAGGAAGAGSGDPIAQPGPPACFDAFSSSCEPCCPSPEPDCSGKPDGYPGYACTPAPNSFCSCTCSREAWTCAC